MNKLQDSPQDPFEVLGSSAGLPEYAPSHSEIPIQPDQFTSPPYNLPPQLLSRTTENSQDMSQNLDAWMKKVRDLLPTLDNPQLLQNLMDGGIIPSPPQAPPLSIPAQPLPPSIATLPFIPFQPPPAPADPPYPTQADFASLDKEEQLQMCLRGIALGDPTKYKTRMCRNWVAGNCEYGLVCVFAHGHKELRPSVPSPETYSKRALTMQQSDLNFLMARFQQETLTRSVPSSTATLQVPPAPYVLSLAQTPATQHQRQVLIDLQLLQELLRRAGLPQLDIAPQAFAGPSAPSSSVATVVQSSANPLQLSLSSPPHSAHQPPQVQTGRINRVDARPSVEKAKRGRRGGQASRSSAKANFAVPATP